DRCALFALRSFHDRTHYGVPLLALLRLVHGAGHLVALLALGGFEHGSHLVVAAILNAGLPHGTHHPVALFAFRRLGHLTSHLVASLARLGFPHWPVRRDRTFFVDGFILQSIGRHLPL